MTRTLAGLVSGLALAATAGAAELPFGPGERVTMRITYAHILAGHATVAVAGCSDRDPPSPSQEEAIRAPCSELHAGRTVLQFVTEARSEGFFAWLFRFRVADRTVATWDPVSGCSLRLEKHLREGRAVRDQVVVFDPRTGKAVVQDPKIAQTRFEAGRCALDVLSAFFVTRVRGVPEKEPLTLPVFDNGRRYRLSVRFLGRERLDLPAPLGRQVETMIIEPLLEEGTGLFVKEGRLKIWLTDDARRIPVRMRAKVAIGSVSADLESYQR